ncbi:MAG: glycogen synthase GlgA [Candidatus Aminicenantes bacterium]|nr:glycogen synthase GlgA [Candidatus Aminicenantes bacterium]
MNVAFLSSEASPYAKTGGLADVSEALPAALARAGAEVAVFLPFYGEVKARGLTLIKALDSHPMTWQGETVALTVWADPATPYPVCFVECDRYFERSGGGRLYGTPAGDFPDNGERFAFFSKAVLEALKALPFEADIIHANDWQTALAAAYLRRSGRDDPFFARTKTVFTIHNLAYQGLFPPEILGAVGLPAGLFRMEELEYWGQVNFMKAGILYADAVTTVSPRYSREILTPAYGCGLDGLLRSRADALTGILNGIDAMAWDPAKDPLIAAPYSAADPSGKAACKRDLLAAFGLPALRREAPVLGLVSRLVEQKGIDILIEATAGLAALGVQIVVLGTGDAGLESGLRAARERFPSFLGLHLGFNDALARKVFAGSDLFLIPSRYEPCGLTQMIAMAYGAIPVARATGGLDDSIEAYDPGPRTGTGFKFEAPEPGALLEAVRKALRALAAKPDREALIGNAMRADFSWRRPAREYLSLYERLIAG